MATFYLLANGQPGDRAVYYTGKESAYGGELWGNVHEAYRFNTLDEVFDRIKYDGCTASPIIVEMFDTTWEIIQKGIKDYKNGIKSTERNVMHKFNTVSYITNSKKEEM